MNLRNVGFRNYINGAVYTAIHDNVRLSAKDSLFKSADSTPINFVSNYIRQFAIETLTLIPKVSEGIRLTNYPETRWFNGISLDGH